MYITRGLENLYQLNVLSTYLIGHNGFIAGGCFKNLFNNEKIKDIDIFFRNSLDFNKARVYFESEEDWNLYYENKKVVSYKNKTNGVAIELIRTVFGTPEEVINGFDFSITKFAYYTEIITDEETKEKIIQHRVIHHKDYFEHLFCKRLVIDESLPFPIGTFERALRYKGYGYSLCRESKAKLIEGIRRMATLNDDISNSLYDGMD